MHATKCWIAKNIWAKAVTTAAFLINRCASIALNFRTPDEIWSRHPPDYKKLKVFGCIAYAHIRQDKLEPRALKCIFLGYPEGVKAYNLWCLELGMRRCIVSRDVVFNENVMANLTENSPRPNIEVTTESGVGTSRVEFEVEKGEAE